MCVRDRERERERKREAHTHTQAQRERARLLSVELDFFQSNSYNDDCDKVGTLLVDRSKTP